MKRNIAIIITFLFLFQTVGMAFIQPRMAVMAATSTTSDLVDPGLNVLLENQKIPEITASKVSRVLTQLKTWMEEDADLKSGTNLGGVLYWSFEESGNYTLEYPLEENKKVTFSMEFQGNEIIDPTYKVEQNGNVLQQGSVSGSDYYDGVVLQGGKQQRINFHVDNENKLVYIALQNGLNIGEVYPVQLNFERAGDTGGSSILDQKYLMTGFKIFSRPTDWEWINGKYRNKTNVVYGQGEIPGKNPGFQLYFNHPKLIGISGNWDPDWSQGIQQQAQEIINTQMLLQYDSDGNGLLGGNPRQVALKDTDPTGTFSQGFVKSTNDYGLNPDINGEKADYSINIVKQNDSAYPGKHEELFAQPDNIEQMLPGTSYTDIKANLMFTNQETKKKFVFGTVLMQTPSTYLEYEIRNIINWGYVLRIPPEAPYYQDGEFYMKRSDEQDTWYYYEGDPQAQQWKPQVTVDPSIDYNFIDPTINKKNAIYVRFEPYDEQDNIIYSQIYIFHTDNVEALPEYTPTNASVNNVNVVPQLFPQNNDQHLNLDNGYPQEADFRLSWDIPEEGLQPNNSSIQYNIKLLHQSYDVDPYTIKKYRAVNRGDYVELLDETDENDIKSVSTYSWKEDNTLDSSRFQVDIQLIQDGEDISYIDSNHKEPPVLQKTHYIQVEAIDEENGRFPSTSQPIVIENKYFSLERRNIHIPGPEQVDLTYPTNSGTTQAINQESIQIDIQDTIYGGKYDDLLKKMGYNKRNPLLPEPYYTKGYPISYEVYIATDQKYLEQLEEDEQLMYEGTLSDSTDITFYPQDDNLQDEVDPALVENGVYDLQDSDLLHDSSVKGVLKLKVPSSVTDVDSSQTDPIHDTTPLQINGLQPNIPYYVMVRTVLDMNYTTTTDQEGTLFTDPTVIDSIRTKTGEQPPTSDEMVPLRPEQPRIVSGSEDSSVFLEWDYLSEDQDNIKFEVLRLPKKSFDELNDLGTLDIVDIPTKDPFSAMKDQIEMWRGDLASGDILYNQDQVSDGWEDYGRNLQPTVLDQPDVGATLHFEDYLVKGNNLYYYYVRTIRTDAQDGSLAAASPWIGVPVTTPGLPGPILYDLPELRGNDVEYDDGDLQYIDPTKEALICFDNPYNSASGNYDFEIFVKGEKDTEFIKADGENQYDAEEVDFKGEVSVSIDTTVATRYFYKITGLTYGTAYEIKVRTIDLDQEIQTDPEVIHAYSHDSNTIEIRTDFDQKEYDQEEEVNNRIDDFNQRIDEYFKKHFWELDYNKLGRYAIKLRGDYIESDLAAYGRRTYELYTLNSRNDFLYYIPWENIRYMNRKNISFLAGRYGTKITIRPGTFDDQWLVEQLPKEDRDRYAGYYIAMKIHYIEENQNQIQMTASQSGVTIGFDLYGSRYSDKDLELRWTEKLYESGGLIDQIKEQFARRLRRLNETDETLIKQWVDKQFEYFKEDVAAYIKEDMTSQRITQKLLSIEEMQVPVLLQMKTNNATAYMKGYRYTSNGTIQSMDVSAMRDQVMMEVNEPDTYYFAQENRPSYPYDEAVNKMIVQYNLSKVLGYSHHPQDQVSYTLLYQVLAKVTGMKEGQDPQLWLRQKGILSVSGYPRISAVSKGKAVMTLMGLYESIHRIQYRSIQITNYGAIVDLDGLLQNERQSLLTAYQLGWIEVDEESKYHPEENITIDHLLHILSKIIM